MPTLFRDVSLNETKYNRVDNKFIVSGIFQKSNVRNANGRVYKLDLWKKLLDSPAIKESLKNRTMLGELGHPDIVETTLTNVSHIVTKLYLNDDGEVYGEAEILDTPSGKILKTLYEAGVKIGISSRGYLPEGSTLIPEGDDLVVPDDFQLIGFDFVLTPSTPGAYPSIKEDEHKKICKILEESKDEINPDVVSYLENINVEQINEQAPSQSPGQTLICKEENNIENKLLIKIFNVDEKKLQDIFNDLKEKFPKFNFSNCGVNEATGKIEMDINLYESEINLFSINLHRFLSKNYPEFDIDMKALIESKIVDLPGSIFKKINLIGSEKGVKENMGKVHSHDYAKKLEDILFQLRERYLLSEEVINELVSQNKYAFDVIKEIKNRYLTAEQIIEEFRDYTSSMEKVVNDLIKLYKVSEEVIEELTGRYTLSEEALNDLKSRYLEAEEVIKQFKDLYRVSENVIEDLKGRYLRAEEVIENLSQRYTLSEEIISELRTIINSAEDTLSESIPEVVSESYIWEQAEKYGVTFREAKKIYNRTQGNKSEFEKILRDRQEKYENRYGEFPVKRLEQRIDEKVDSSEVSTEVSKLASIIARVM